VSIGGVRASAARSLVRGVAAPKASASGDLTTEAGRA